MEDAIKTCQSGGKKVFLSIGGALGSEGINLASEKDADDAASVIWDIFGGGTGADKDLRPFGDVKLDGFDIGKLDPRISRWHMTHNQLKNVNKHAFADES